MASRGPTVACVVSVNRTSRLH